MYSFESKIRDVPDFPKKGIVFKDITTLLKDKKAFGEMITEMAGKVKDKQIDIVVGIESRGFIIGAAIAHQLGCGFVPVRKPGKLPSKTYKEEYTLEYGKDALEIHQDAISRGQKVLIIDDVLATGGTILATCKLVEKLGGDIQKIMFLIELGFLGGMKKIDKYKGKVESLINYSGE
jgi:adenine phosphoribosyltransferase